MTTPPTSLATSSDALSDEQIKRAISEAIGFDWKQGELQAVNAHDLFNIARAIAALPSPANTGEGEYPPLPQPSMISRLSGLGYFGDDQMRAYVDADRASRASGQGQAGAVEAERQHLRARQAAAVMPQIGSLLDAWNGIDNDTKGMIREQAPGLARNLAVINCAMEDCAHLAAPGAAIAAREQEITKADVLFRAKEIGLVGWVSDCGEWFEFTETQQPSKLLIQFAKHYAVLASRNESPPSSLQSLGGDVGEESAEFPGDLCRRCYGSGKDPIPAAPKAAEKSGRSES